MNHHHEHTSYQEDNVRATASEVVVRPHSTIIKQPKVTIRTWSLVALVAIVGILWLIDRMNYRGYQAIEKVMRPTEVVQVDSEVNQQD